MREGWTYKKLGEVCLKLTDGSHNPPKGIPMGEFKMISSQNVFNDHILLNDVRYLTEEDFIKEDKRTNVKENDVLLTIVGTIGRCAVVTQKEGAITLQRSVAVLSPNSSVISRFLMYCLIGNNGTLNNIAHGIAQKGIYLKQLSNVPIPVPPLSVQQSIVSELDMLSGLIAKHEEQLKAYDELAQSIFYDMFGDPVENEKGWEVKNLGDIVSVTDYVANGSFATLRENVHYLDRNGYAILIRLADFSNNFDQSKFIYIDEHAYNFLAKSKLYGGEIIMSNVGSIGKCFICPKLQMPMSLAPNSIVINTPNNIFYFHYFNSRAFYYQLHTIASKTALPKFNKTQFKNLMAPLPPLSLQQSFAEKIEAIERQKERIRQSMAEVKTLFDSRMDYYFN